MILIKTEEREHDLAVHLQHVNGILVVLLPKPSPHMDWLWKGDEEVGLNLVTKGHYT